MARLSLNLQEKNKLGGFTYGKKWGKIVEELRNTYLEENMLKKLDEVLFGNTSRKIERITKCLAIIFAIFGALLLVAGIGQIATFISYGWSDPDVLIGVIITILGFNLLVGGYVGSLLCIGFAKIVRNAEYDEYLDDELFECYDDDCQCCTEDTCDGCKMEDDIEEVVIKE